MNNYDLTGYISPIQRIVEDVQFGIEEHEGQILMKAVHNVGFDIDKHELMKALAYDREQYQKGYDDAMETVCGILADHLGFYLCGISMMCDEHCLAFQRSDRKKCWRRILARWIDAIP